MPHSYTPHLELLKIDPNVEMSLSDFIRFFQTDKQTVDANIQALYDRIEAITQQGHTPVSPVDAGSRLMFRVENAANLLDLPAILASLPNGTFVRATGFTFVLRSKEELDALYSALDSLNGLDASNNGLNKAQMSGLIRLERADASTGTPVTVTGAQIQAWKGRYPSVEIVPERIRNLVYYYNYAGTELLHTETVYDNADAAYEKYPMRESSESGYGYIFLGWSNSVNSTLADATLDNVSRDLTVYAAHLLIEDVPPTISVRRYATAPGGETVINISDWGSYSRVVSMSSVNAAGKPIKTNTGDGLVAFDAENDSVSITAAAEYFTGVLEWSLNFADSRERGGLVCSVPFMLKNLPSVSVRKKSTGSRDTIIIDVSSFGAYSSVTEFGFKVKDKTNANSSLTQRTVGIGGNNYGSISVDDNVIVLIAIAHSGNNDYIIANDGTAYVKFSNATNTDTVTLVLDMFDLEG